MGLLAHWTDEDVDRIYRRLDGGTFGTTSKDAIRAVLAAAEAVPPTHRGAVGVLEEIAAMPADPSLITSNPEARMRRLAKRWLSDHTGGQCDGSVASPSFQAKSEEDTDG